MVAYILEYLWMVNSLPWQEQVNVLKGSTEDELEVMPILRTGDLDPEQSGELLVIINRYRHLFVYDPGGTELAQTTVENEKVRPIRQQPYRG